MWSVMNMVSFELVCYEQVYFGREPKIILLFTFWSYNIYY